MENRESGTFSHRKLRLRILLEGGILFGISFSEQSGGGGEPSAEMTRICQQLGEYFAGNRKEFEVRVYPEGTPFQKKVWDAIREIPYGETQTYKEIAKKIGHPGAYRAVGQAAGRNPTAIVIPCHRVIGSDGSHTGYAGGLDLKRWLLEMEQRFKA